VVEYDEARSWLLWFRPPRFPSTIDDAAAADANLHGVGRGKQRLFAVVLELFLIGVIVMIGAACQGGSGGDLERDVTLQEKRCAHKDGGAIENHPPSPVSGAGVNCSLDRQSILRRAISLGPILADITDHLCVEAECQRGAGS
jgi:hypothetical protein